ncbi:MAG: hypothetical protein FJ098_01670 [Deltaproteobacteria bacterium]|nr:hypothetical protein [Deltaproteobacteria bacterium]
MRTVLVCALAVWVGTAACGAPTGGAGTDTTGRGGDATVDLAPRETGTAGDVADTAGLPDTGEDILPDLPSDRAGDGPVDQLADAPMDGSADDAPMDGSAEDGGDAPGGDVAPDTSPCLAPSFPEDCADVSAFQCGFMGQCQDGALKVDWHHHWFCDGQESITDFSCTHACPHGCTEGELMDWPPDGAALVQQHCHACSLDSDCPDPGPGGECPGAWACVEGACAWVCSEECLGVGEGFLDFNTEGKCCPGLTPSPDCELLPDGACSCPKCPCYVCLPCGDGVCGPFEHLCNCPADCTTAEKCVPVQKSECEGDPYGTEAPGGTLEVTVLENEVFLEHGMVAMNCCVELELCYTAGFGQIQAVESIVEPYTPCFCECLFDLSASIEGIPSGEWTLTLTSEAQPAVDFEVPVPVP